MPRIECVVDITRGMSLRTERTVDVARWNVKRSGHVRARAIRRARRCIANNKMFPEYMILSYSGRDLVGFGFFTDISVGIVEYV